MKLTTKMNREVMEEYREIIVKSSVLNHSSDIITQDVAIE